MNIALLSSYTTDILQNKLESFLKKDFNKVKIYGNSFNQYTQEILNKKSAFYAFSPEIIIFLFSEETWIENPTQMFKLLQLIKRRLPKALILVGNIVPTHSQLLPGLEWNKKNSLSEKITICNLKLAKFCQNNKQFYTFDVNNLVLLYGRIIMFDQRIQYLTKNPWSDKGMDILSFKLSQHIKTLMGKRKKVVVLDLDNTLWGGILGEVGLENILLSNDGVGKAYYDFQKNLLKLHQSGILLVICSKNDEVSTLRAIETHPYMLIKKHHLAAWRMNWESKADNLVSIANELNLGTDSFVFLDDTAYERDLIRFALPSVEVPDFPADPSEYSEFLSNLPAFDTGVITEEDKKRNEMYQQEKERSSKKLSAASLEKFLKSLHIEVTIQKVKAFNTPRIAQLTQKTNQFNLTNRRYTDEQINELIKDKKNIVLGISSKDKVGDMGLVGVIIAKKNNNSLFVDTFLMSCRVLGRGIEETVLFSLSKYATQLAAFSIIGEFIPSKKNNLAKSFYSNNYFTQLEDGFFKYDVKKKKIKKPQWITLHYD